MLRLGSSFGGFEKQLLGELAAANAEVALSTLRVSTGKKINARASLSILQQQQASVVYLVQRLAGLA